MDRTMGLGEFLRTRRARLLPADVGVEPRGRRRVPGLRREELARLAGVSVDYYTRLEQGRSHNASPEVLEAIADALRLDETERTHLLDLACPPVPARHRRPEPPQRVRPETHQLLDTLHRAGAPAFVVGRRCEILAQNALFRGMASEYDLDSLPARERNAALLIFLHPRARHLHPDWEQVTEGVVAMLRFEFGRHPDDPLLGELIEELWARSGPFRLLWANHDVHERVVGTKRYNHPVVGMFTVTYQTLTLPGVPDQTLYVYTVEPGTPSADALRELAAWVEKGSCPLADEAS
ncbi:helix-turn-helix transcriptional regulator [Sphaerisporangium sp. TRM90804]|uniref:helix-turn-helix transcriptional regulator n=1 Tax=Sphaerisporangium sp. TRM90804 TaxID=3031113 RepID=UPI00244CF334|nr:helix-turn-helix transcriptional regulator [Sphaerisporangium sp. TRM90804]MDH2430683.1 helix-turn-helix transcriptional regulator [Sphaerisporangium sp. TRM90804]